jgi:hypothetical protein
VEASPPWLFAFATAVFAESLATVLFEPGTTVRPVAPGFVGLVEPGVGIVAFAAFVLDRGAVELSALAGLLAL